MVVVSETKESQLLALLEQCVHLDADVRPRTEKGFFTVTVPPPWNGSARRAAQAIQDQIKEWSKQYPNVVCYCFDGYLCAVKQCGKGMGWALACSVPFYETTERRSLWDIFQKWR